MAEEQGDSRLEILEDMQFQERDWTRERVGWIAIAVILLVAVLGGFGHGLLGYRSVADGEGKLNVTYEQVARRGGVTNLDVTITAGAIVGDRVQLHLPDGYLDHIDIEAITPEPAESLPDGEGIVFEFQLDDQTPGDVTIRFDLRPDQVGTAEATVELVDHTSVRFEQLLLP
jgi:hypothetical protein